MRVRHAPCIVPPMSRYAKALSRAEKILGSRARMVAFFGVPPEKIQAWLDGEEEAPLEVFLRSLDVIADGPYAPRGRKRVRVAVIDQR
jgi:hypothetical protein